ncbi:hypothetical protein D3C72_949960 [compost metagenome]
MNTQRFAQIEAGGREQRGGERQGHGQAAHARVGFGFARQLGGEGLELARELFLGGVEQVPDLLAALGVVFAEAAQVALGQALHQLLDLVAAQMATEQRDALALFLGLEDVEAGGDQGHQGEDFHGCEKRGEKRRDKKEAGAAAPSVGTARPPRLWVISPLASGKSPGCGCVLQAAAGRPPARPSALPPAGSAARRFPGPGSPRCGPA